MMKSMKALFKENQPTVTLPLVTFMAKIQSHL